jgi:hypothetical protein
LTVCLVVLGRNIPQFSFLNVLLGSEAVLTPEDRLHQRLLARVPTRWNHLVEKNSRKFNGMSMIFSQKWFPLLAFML